MVPCGITTAHRVLFANGVLLLSGLVLGATCTKEEARTAVDAAAYGCVLANASLEDDHVAEVCGLAQAVLPAVRELLKAHRAEMRKMGARPCTGPDAGPEGG